MDGKTAKTTIAANMAVERGVMVVVSMGNEGKSLDWPYMSAPADRFNGTLWVQKYSSKTASNTSV